MFPKFLAAWATGLALAAASIATTTAWATRSRAWMTEDEMRAAFAGQTLDGHYGNQTSWTETYFADGRIDYTESARFAKGRWSFRGGSFCTFYDPPFVPDFVGGCWQVLQQGANCYEFYSAGYQLPDQSERNEEDDSGAGGLERPLRWNARGWRRSAPSTCPEKPTV